MDTIAQASERVDRATRQVRELSRAVGRSGRGAAPGIGHSGSAGTVSRLAVSSARSSITLADPGNEGTSGACSAGRRLEGERDGAAEFVAQHLRENLHAEPPPRRRGDARAARLLPDHRQGVGGVGAFPATPQATSTRLRRRPKTPCSTALLAEFVHCKRHQLARPSAGGARSARHRRLLAFADEMDHQLVRDQRVQADLAERSAVTRARAMASSRPSRWVA